MGLLAEEDIMIQALNFKGRIVNLYINLIHDMITMIVHEIIIYEKYINSKLI